MTIRVALPISSEYVETSNEVRDSLLEKSSRPLSKQVIKSTNLLIDDLFKVMVHDMLDQVSMKPMARKIVEQVSGLILKTVNVFVKKVVSKLHNKELLPLVEYFKALELERDGQTYLSYEVTPNMEELIPSCIEHVEEGRTAEAKKELIIILEDFIDHSLDIYLVKPMSLIKLGLIAKKLMDLTQTTIEKAMPPALHKIVNQMDHDELLSLKEFLLSMLIFEAE